MPATIQLQLRRFATMDAARCSVALQPADQHGLAARIAVRERQLLGRAFRRQVLADALAAHPAELTIATTALGKPFLSSHPLNFNCSHSHSSYALAWSAEVGPLGVDTEDESRAVHMERIARTSFSVPERRALAAARNPLLTWLTIWTRKEAALKCCGAGMRIPLADVPTGSPLAAMALVDGPCGRLRLHSWQRNGQVLSLAYPVHYATTTIILDDGEQPPMP